MKLPKEDLNTIGQLDTQPIVTPAEEIFADIRRLVDLANMENLTPENIKAVKVLLQAQTGYQRAIITKMGILKLSITPAKVSAIKKFSQRFKK